MSIEKRIPLNSDGLSLSRLVLGAWRLLDQGAKPSAAEVARLIDEAISLVLTSFDHADIYG
ncbi:oxidoreductase, partial [Enterobacter hormaechei]|nr:oxidoreductase [Enterobacter hormaechei]